MDYITSICKLFWYDDSSGSLLRRTSRGDKYQVGSSAGYIEPKKHTSYRKVKIGAKSIFVHRLIWEICNGVKLEKDEHIDHIDGNGLNNKIENLRKVSHRENHCNKKIHRDGKLPGCYFNKTQRVWFSRICINGKKIWLGSYKTENEAHIAYVKYKQVHMEDLK